MAVRKQSVGNAALANKRRASAVKLQFTPTYTFWKQCAPKLVLQEFPHTLAGSLQRPFAWRFPPTALYLPQKLSRTKGPRAAIIM